MVELAGDRAVDASIVERLDRADLRYTTSRRAIVSALRSAGGPVTLPELLDLVPDLATSSAYRNLSLLEGAGVVRRLVTGDDHSRYELAESLTEHHHHLICQQCGLVRDVTLADPIESALDEAFDDVAAREGFTLSSHAIDIYGLCPDCG
ncbi:MAG TPA: Fur family transcriptional regulator [Ilumatobacter sp.]|nr:Fur family transcriptional regulator [Ilumatobacter sp.]